MRVVLTCGACTHESPEGARFCAQCGAPLEQAPADHEVRKVVTIVFSDVVGSTSLGERLDPERLRLVMSRYFDAMEAAVARHGGAVEKFIGDAVMAIFGVPRLHEDDALRAVRAAWDMREALGALNERLQAEHGVRIDVRTGVNTGEVVVGRPSAQRGFAIGDAVNVAARLEQAAGPGEILLGEETWALVRHAARAEAVAPLDLKGKSAHARAFRLLAVDRTAGATARSVDGAFVGRTRELRALRDAFERAVEDGGCHLFTLLGDAGVGKSRLVAEFLGRIGEQARVAHGRCLHYGDGITFFPIVEVLLQLGERAAPALTMVKDGDAASPNELFLAVRQTLEGAARERPLIVVLDDLHWAESMLLDLLDHVTDLSRNAPILLLCVARAELLEARPGWSGGKLNATTVLLAPLRPEESAALLAELGGGLDPAARERVIAAGAGNPLFLQEMTAFVREAGGVRVPRSIHALLAARIERLRDAERAVVERAAVEGEVFHRGAVQDLVPEPVRAGVGEHLVALVRKELIRPEEPEVPGEEAYRFRHLLIRDAAYDALPKRSRADLHERFATWFEEHAAAHVELDEVAGWHLEQTARYRAQLHLPDDGDATTRAVRHLRAAARRAAGRGDKRAAAALLRRALDLLPAGHPARPELALALAEPLTDMGDFAAADALLDEAERAPALQAAADLARADVIMAARPEEAEAFAEERLARALAAMHASGDDRGIARAELALVRLDQLRSRTRPVAERARRAAAHARAAGDRGLVAQALMFVSFTYVHGPYAPGEMREWVAELRTDEDLATALGWMIDLLESVIARIDGRFDDARAAHARSQAALHELGFDVMRCALGQDLGTLERAAGRPEAAIAALEAAAQQLAQLGERSYRSTCLAMLALARLDAGDPDGAERAALEAGAETAAVDFVNFALGGAVRACVASMRGDHATAESLARGAVEQAYRTDMPLVRGEVRRALGIVLAAAGRPDEARAAFGEALAEFEVRRDRTNAARVRAALARL